MATITEDYVSFEVAKLLKEKGFTGNEIYKYYDVSDEKPILYSESYIHEFDKDFWMKNLIMAPTLQMAMKLLREVHKIHIIAEPCLGEGNEPNLSFDRWFWTILKEEGEYKPIRQIDEFPTYEEACEAAIKYCLENLI